MALCASALLGQQSSDLLPTSPAALPLAYSCSLDLSDGLPSTTDEGGFLTVGDGGRLLFTDGRRARFWGVNIARDGVLVDWAVVDRAVDVLARAGVNLVRFHHVDGPDGILSPDRLSGGDYFDADHLKTLDYWVDRLGSRGIHVYLDLLDFREFAEEEGVQNARALGRGAKPYAVFVPRLIELQKEYATKLLREHVNPFSGLAYADDPTVALIELFDENGLFIRNGELPTLASPYREMLAERWSDWLGARYQSTDRLARAWAGSEGGPGLAPGERLEAHSVALPVLFPSAEDNLRPVPIQRRIDGARFLYELHLAYYAEMRDHLRTIGVRQPVGAVGSLDRLPDIAAITKTLDFVGTNFYWDHPAWQEGRAWREPFFYSDWPPLKDDGRFSLAWSVPLARVRDVPLVVREWSYCWPNQARATGMAEMAAFLSLQDVDVALAFTYQPTDQVKPLDFFDMHHDVTRWGLFALLGRAFVNGLISPAKHEVVFAHSEQDLLGTTQYRTPMYAAAWATRVSNAFYTDSYDAQADWTVSMGRLPGGVVRGDGRILRQTRWARARAGGPEAELAWLSGYPVKGAAIASDSIIPLALNGLMYGEGARSYSDAGVYDLAALRDAGYEPIGVNENRNVALGLRDVAHRTYAFRELSDPDVLRLLLDLIGRDGGPPLSHMCVDTRSYVSDTDEVVRDAASGLLVVRAPAVRAIAWSGAGGLAAHAGGLAVRTRSTPCVVVGLSLDGSPLESSQRYVAKCVTVAENARQHTSPVERGPKRYLIDSLGVAPPETLGRPDATGTRLVLGDSSLLTVRQRDGSWELVRDGATFRFVTDTDGARVSVCNGPEVDCRAGEPILFGLDGRPTEAGGNEPTAP